LVFPGPLKKGDCGDGVKRVQEWLCFHRRHIAIDGQFGPVTAAALGADVLDDATWAQLVDPMVCALRVPDAQGHGLRELAVAIARQHLAQRPIEIGGDNRGPWVRLYMGGCEGLPWCAGFATFIVGQAAQALGVLAPQPYKFGCDELADRARGLGTFLRPTGDVDLARIAPGWLFLVPKGENHWQHVGIVVGVQNGMLSTIEGNSNEDGSSNGWEVVARTRSAVKQDYLIV